MSQPINAGKKTVVAGEIGNAADFNGVQDNYDDQIRNLAKLIKSLWVAGFAASISGTTIVVTHDGADAWANGKRFSSPHKVKDTTNTVPSSSVDATSYQARLNAIATAYEAHRTSTTYHQNGDTVNVVTSGSAVDLATARTRAKELKKLINAHMGQAQGAGSPVHYVPDGQNRISSILPDLLQVSDSGGDTVTITADATEAQLVTATNDLTTKWLAHLNAEIFDAFEFTAQPSDPNPYYVYINSSTNVLAASLAVPGNQHVVLCSVIWNGTTLSSLTDLRAAYVHMDLLQIATKMRFGDLKTYLELFVGTGSALGSIGFGGAPNATALIDLVSTTRGFRAPSMTTTQRDAIVSPATGLLIYNTSNSRYEFYNGTSWQSVGADGSAFSGIISKDHDPASQTYAVGLTTLATYDIGANGQQFPQRVILPATVDANLNSRITFEFHDGTTKDVDNTDTANAKHLALDDLIDELMAGDAAATNNGKRVRKAILKVNNLSGGGILADLGAFRYRAYAAPIGTGAAL